MESLIGFSKEIRKIFESYNQEDVKIFEVKYELRVSNGVFFVFFLSKFHAQL